MTIWGIQPVTQLPELEGYSYPAVVASLGPPEQSTPLTVDSGCGLYEYQVELCNLLRSDSDSFEVRESAWRRGPWQLVVWFRREDSGWRSVDALRWNAAMVEF